MFTQANKYKNMYSTSAKTEDLSTNSSPWELNQIFRTLNHDIPAIIK